MLWIIVPYRDDEHHERSRQLHTFLDYMTRRLPLARFIIAEQDQDGKQFNRGAILNAAFQKIFQSTNASDAVIFHDVDLLPDDIALRNYCIELKSNRVRHIGRLWKRYDSETYLGGVLMMLCRDFVKINGYPNNYWGWGGEDDELRKRILHHHITITAPKQGSLSDLENLSLTEKLSKLKHNKSKCMTKWENNAEYDEMRKRHPRALLSGLKHVHYTSQYKTLHEYNNVDWFTIHLQRQ